jgi:hypothetical protein
LLIVGLFLITSLSIFLGSCDEEFETPPEVVISDDFVDLRPQQSSLKDQGGRTTCIVFAGIAATEAAYKRLGYGELDLSEEFNNFTRKAFYLHPIWTDYQVPDGIKKRETQLGHTGGGGGTGVVAELATGFKVPLEEVMPYQSNPNYYPNNYPVLADSKSSAGTVTQLDYSNFNLDPAILTDEILRTKKFYSVAQYRFLDDAKDPAEIETILKRGFEVVWDFSGTAPWDAGGIMDGIWQKCDACSPIAHAMLIVGFDKRDSNPDNHYFIVKNSWNSFTAPDGDGYTYISYEYVRNYGISANYIRLVNPPTEWPELAFIGWKLNFDGFKGDLDIYHLPGMAEFTFEFNFDRGTIPEQYEDYRLGTFYDVQGNPFRVNGHVNGNQVEFYIDGDKPLLRWDEISSRKFIYYLDSTNFMAGYHEDGNGAKYGGYATKSSYLPNGTQTPRPFLDNSYFNSNWDFQSIGYKGTLNFNKNLTSEFEDFFLLEGTYTPTGGSAAKAQIKIMRNETNKVSLQMANMGDGEVGSFIGRHLSWESGVITGNTPETGTSYPFYMIRK